MERNAGQWRNECLEVKSSRPALSRSTERGQVCIEPPRPGLVPAKVAGRWSPRGVTQVLEALRSFHGSQLHLPGGVKSNLWKSTEDLAGSPRKDH
jgi:hypothetical protein